MAKEQKPIVEPILETDASPPPPKSYRMHILLGLAVVALTETIVIWFMIPSPERLQKTILDLNQRVTTIDDTYNNVITQEVIDKDVIQAPVVEKPIGEKIKVQSTRPDEQLTDIFTVTIQVQVLKKDETAFDKVYAERQGAVRDAVTIVLRASTIEDRNQVSLTTIKRKIREVINEVLGTAYVKGVLCIDPIAETI
jgi:hypothetical protein